MFTINLNQESAAVLLRCLSYGEAAISYAETKTGVAEVVTSNINSLKSQVTTKLYKSIISKTANKSNRQ